MTQVQSLDELARRPLRAAEVDGLNDVLGGISLVAITGMQFAGAVWRAAIVGPQFWTSRAFFWGTALWVVSTIAMFAVIIGSKRVVRSLRERYVYPRLGYVAPRAEPGIRRKLVMLGMTLAAAVLVTNVTLALVKTSGFIALFTSGVPVVALGVFWGIACFVHFAKLGFLRHLALGGIAVAVSLFLSSGQWDTFTSLNLLVLIVGTASILIGAVTFAELRRAPVILDEGAGNGA